MPGNQEGEPVAGRLLNGLVLLHRGFLSGPAATDLTQTLPEGGRAGSCWGNGTSEYR